MISVRYSASSFFLKNALNLDLMPSVVKLTTGSFFIAIKEVHTISNRRRKILFANVYYIIIYNKIVLKTVDMKKRTCDTIRSEERRITRI